jgi:hypothetical protein
MPAPIMLSPTTRTANGVGILDQQLVEIERPVQIVIGRRGKSCRHAAEHQRHCEPRAYDNTRELALLYLW